MSVKVLSLSCTFPNPQEPQRGIFICRRLQKLAAWVELKVVAPLPAIDYGHPGRKWLASRSIPFRRWDDTIEVLHPRWLYPPFSGVFGAVCLFLQMLWRVARLRRRFAFQVIDAHFGHPEGVACSLLAATLHVPFIVTLRGNESMHAAHRWRRYMLGWTLRRASRVITVSGRLREFAISMGADPARTKTIPNGVDAELFFPHDRAAARSQHGIEADARMILSAGFLIERKGHHHIIRALQAIRERGIPAELWIAGSAGREGRYEHVLHNLVSELELGAAVRFVGAVPPTTLAQLISAADVFCLASSREGWPNVVHEALACGTPVISTDVGGVPDMIPSDQYGLVVPIGDQAALEEALACALQRKWDRTQISAWAHSRSWEQVAREVLAEIQAVIEEQARERGQSQ